LQDPNSYFHAQFSGRWNSDDVKAFEVKERSGRFFWYVLYYLKFGDLPHNSSSGRTLLDEETLKLLKEEADFFLLPQLAKLCDDPSVAPLFMVSEYSMDSDKSTGVNM